MIKIEKYTGTKTYMTPGSALATPEVIKKEFPATEAFVHIAQTDDSGQVIFAIQNLAAIRSQMGIDPTLTEDQAIAEIQARRNAPEPEPEISTEERTAAALEFIAVSNM